MKMCKRCGRDVQSSHSTCDFCGEIIDDNSWIEIVNSSDIESLLDTFGGFHDSCIKELHLWGRHFVRPNLMMRVSEDLDYNVRIFFQRQWENPSAIEMWFEEVIQLHVVPSPVNYDSIILEASLQFENGIFYWADSKAWIPHGNGSEEVTWIAAKKLRWRDVSSWLGAELRYGEKI